MTLVSQRQTRINRGLEALRKELPAKDKQLYAGFTAAKRAITTILKSVDAEKIKITSPNDLYKVSVSLSALIKAQTDYERWNAERYGYRAEAREEVEAMVRNWLATMPELRDQLLEVIENVGLHLEAGADEECPPLSGETPPGALPSLE
jgi:hypothetical protein